LSDILNWVEGNPKIGELRLGGSGKEKPRTAGCAGRG
jgi:hypothetical protein